MEIVRVMAIALLGLAAIGIVRNFRPETVIYIVLACSLTILFIMLDDLKLIVNYFYSIYDKITYGKNYFFIIIKVLAVAYLTDFTSNICKDAGESALAGKVQFAGKIIIFCLGIPVVLSLVKLVEELM